MAEHIEFRDRGTDSPAFVTIRLDGDDVAIGLGIEADGDLDLVLSSEDARRLGEALVRCADSQT